MIDTARHAPLRPLPWSAAEAAGAIDEIVSDALTHFDPEHYWPVHPADELSRDGETGFYFGATGMIWALHYLSRVGAVKQRVDFRPVLTGLLEANQTQFRNCGEYSVHGSFMIGDLGTALLVMRCRPTAKLPISSTRAPAPTQRCRFAS
jgi:hypothetical protein